MDTTGRCSWESGEDSILTSPNFSLELFSSYFVSGKWSNRFHQFHMRTVFFQAALEKMRWKELEQTREKAAKLRGEGLASRNSAGVRPVTTVRWENKRDQWIKQYRAVFSLVSKTKTKVIPVTNHNKDLHYHWPMRTQNEIGKLREARENANDQVAVVYSFASDWLKVWREFSGPITKRS